MLKAGCVINLIVFFSFDTKQNILNLKDVHFLCACAYKYLVPTKPISLDSTLKDHKLYLIEVINATFENIIHSPTMRKNVKKIMTFRASKN